MAKMKRLEEHQLFSFIAWTLIIGFALFTYFLATSLKKIIISTQPANVILDQN